MASIKKQTTQVVRNLLYLLAGILIVANATVELIFGPIIILKTHAIGQYSVEPSEPLLSFMYGICILVQVLNILASLCFFLGIFLTGYHEKWLAYDTVSLISVSLSLSLLMNGGFTTLATYRAQMEKDMYMYAANVADLQCSRFTAHCSRLEIVRWHQSSQCCGWDSAQDLLEPRLSNRTILPAFCCLANLNHKYHYRCQIESMNTFWDACRSKRDSFLQLSTMALVNYPFSEMYIFVKILAALTYTFLKKHSPLPLSEGLFSHYMTTQ